jgi:hypothetical protein
MLQPDPIHAVAKAIVKIARPMPVVAIPALMQMAAQEPGVGLAGVDSVVVVDREEDQSAINCLRT